MSPALLLTLLACTLGTEELRDDDTGLHQGMPDAQECSDTLTTLAMDEPCPLGFSADEVLAVVAGPVEASGTWTADGATVLVSLAASAGGAPIYHDRAPMDDTGGPEDTGPAMGAPDDACQDWLELPLDLVLITDDGAFDEVVSATMLAMDLAALWASAELDWAALGGSYTFDEIDPDDWDEVGLAVSAGWFEGLPTGQVDMSASRSVSDTMGEGLVGPVLRW
jgi:hypothetical protein